MNVGVVLMALILISAASIGIVAMANSNSAPVTDTLGNTLSSDTNTTHNIITNVSSPLATFGGGLALAVGVVLVCGLLFAVLVLILYSRKGNGGSGRR